MRRVQPDAAYERMTRNRRLIRQVPCPRCGVPVGAPCHTPNGNAVTVDHSERRHAAAEAGVYTP